LSSPPAPCLEELTAIPGRKPETGQKEAFTAKNRATPQRATALTAREEPLKVTLN